MSAEQSGIEERDYEMLRSYFGEAVCEALDDPTVNEILVRPGWCAVDRAGTGLEALPGVKCHIVAVLRLLAPLAGAELSYEDPEVELSLPPWRARFAGLYAGVNGCDSFFSIRIHRLEDFSLASRVKKGGYREDNIGTLRSCLAEAKAGWLIVGPTGAGKTAWLRTFLQEIVEQWGSKQHLFTVEDSRELWLEGPMVSSIETTKRLTYRQAVRVALRQKPDRLIVQEARGGEAFDALKGGATGHGLWMTVHASTAAGGIRMCERRAKEGAENGILDRDLLPEALKYVFSVQRRGADYTIAEALRFHGYTGNDRPEFTPLFERL